MTAGILDTGPMANLTPLPKIDGAHFRFARGPEDGSAFEAIHQARQEIDGVDPSDSYEMVGTAREFEEALAKQRESGTLCLRPVVEAGGEIVAYGKLEDWKEGDGTTVYLLQGWVHPKARGRGIGSALLSWLERESSAFAARDHAGEPCEFAANASSTETNASELLANAGYAAAYTVAELRLDPARYAEERPADAALPDGLAIGKPSRDEYRKLTETVVAAFAKEYEEGRFDEPVDPDEYEEELADDDRDPSLWRVVRRGDEIVAVALCDRRTEAMAEVVELAVSPAWRRKGIARALMTETIDAAIASGCKDIRIYTIEQFQTRAIMLYRSLGFSRYKDFPRYRKPMPGSVRPATASMKAPEE